MLNRTLPLTGLWTCLLMSACGHSVSSTQSITTITVSSAQDQFSEDFNGRKVEFRDWTLFVDGQSISIEKQTSVIQIKFKNGDLDIFVNDKQVYDE